MRVIVMLCTELRGKAGTAWLITAMQATAKQSSRGRASRRESVLGTVNFTFTKDYT